MLRITKKAENFDRDLRVLRLFFYLLATGMACMAINYLSKESCIELTGYYGSMFTGICSLMGVKIFALFLVGLGVASIIYAHSKSLRQWLKTKYT